MPYGGISTKLGSFQLHSNKSEEESTQSLCEQFDTQNHSIGKTPFEKSKTTIATIDLQNQSKSKKLVNQDSKLLTETAKHVILHLSPP